MKKTNIVKWEPIENIPSRLYLEGLHDDYKGFRLFLKGENENDNVLRIEFPSYIGYRNIDEINRLKTLYDNSILTSLWPLFISEDDDFTKWIIDESSGTIDNITDYKNYIICTPNDIIDIVSNDSPKVEWL